MTLEGFQHLAQLPGATRHGSDHRTGPLIPLQVSDRRIFQNLMGRSQVIPVGDLYLDPLAADHVLQVVHGSMAMVLALSMTSTSSANRSASSRYWVVRRSVAPWSTRVRISRHSSCG